MIKFPLAAEFHMMSALLDSHVVIKDIAAENAALRRVGFIAEGQRGAVHVDVRSIETRTVGALLPCRQRVAVRPEGVGVAELVHQRRREGADKRKNTGIGPFVLFGHADGIDPT
jgi:hypothetical protein